MFHQWARVFYYIDPLLKVILLVPRNLNSVSGTHFVRVVNIRKTHAVLQCRFYEALIKSHNVFQKLRKRKEITIKAVAADVCRTRMAHETNI